MMCFADAATEYGCPWGTACGTDVGARYQDQYCPSEGALCTGALAAPGTWQAILNCDSTQRCSASDHACVFDQTCVSCTSNCSGKECGDDGCGGSCGSCDTGESCSSGQCGGCAGNCLVPGATKCSGLSSYVTCSGSTSCLQWTNETDCPPGLTCSNGDCVDVCYDECVSGSAKCTTVDSWVACSTQPGVSCLRWSSPTYCGAGLTCTNGQCVPICPNQQCFNSGDRKCLTATSYVVCDNYAGEPCLSWGQEKPCPGGQSCVGGQCQCIPDCVGKKCGADGCGGSCGSCSFGSSCVDGSCEKGCSCVEKDCGDDGCGGSCGTCTNACTGHLDPAVCADGSCVQPCCPDCGGRSCGEDGCGGSCGSCAAGWVCSNGACTRCSPSCDERECGADGCGGTCGTCAIGMQCANGKCSSAPASGRANGESCAGNEDCSSGLCLLRGSDSGICREPCSVVNRLCPTDTQCYCYGLSTKGACVPSAGKSDVGEGCSLDSDCSSGICYTGDEARGGFCTAPCCNGCSGGMTCREDGTGLGFCTFAPGNESFPDGEDGSETDGTSGPSPGGGCWMSRYRQIDFGPVVLLLSAFVLAFAAPRRRRRAR
jgi:hypothetical protein